MKNVAIIKYPNFFLLWISQVVSQAGSRIFQIGILWWLLNHFNTAPGRAIALFMILGTLPSIVFVKWIGKTIDQSPTKKVLIINDTLGLILSGVLIFIFSKGSSSETAIFIASFLYSTFFAFINPTLQKAVPELVEKEDTESAVAFISSTSTLADFSGAIIGAMIVDWLGIVGVIAINGLTYLISIICDGVIKFRVKKTETDSKELDQSGNDKLSALAILNKHPLIRKILLGFAAVNFFGTPILVLIPIYAKIKLMATSGALIGYLEACLTLGLIVGTFSSKIFGFKDRPITVVGLCLIIFGTCMILPSFFIQRYLFMIFLFILGLSLGLLNVRMITLFQEVIEDDLKGRFFSLLSAMCGFTVPFGFFVFGLLVDYLSVTQLFMIQGLGVIILSLFFFYLRKDEFRLKKIDLSLEE